MKCVTATTSQDLSKAKAGLIWEPSHIHKLERDLNAFLRALGIAVSLPSPV